jgi:hypothetical protein
LSRTTASFFWIHDIPELPDWAPTNRSASTNRPAIALVPACPCQGSYDGRTLAAWARRIGTWCDQGIDVYCYFDNDEAGYAVENALDLQARLAP